MCGILGFLNCKTEPGLFKRALDTMTHRGPDGCGMWEDDTTTLGHRRLAIIDVSDSAKQPMCAFERFVITFNGEIYNYVELKKELELKGVKFITHSDTEVLLHAYIVWGPQCLNKLNGMWAFAIWDKQEKTLFLSRDRLGKKPLFYSQQNNTFIFSSEMKGIYPFLNTVEINEEIAKAAIQNSFSYETTENCLIKQIKRFPAASYAYYTQAKGLDIKTFWDPMLNKTPVLKNYNEQKEQFRELFLDACKIRMRSDVTIGTALSGGLDSSAVICAMARLYKNSGSGNTTIQKDCLFSKYKFRRNQICQNSYRFFKH
jgi:asparagine synthase (glutamine-hydrolysing)